MSGRAEDRCISLGIGILAALAILVLSYMGTPGYGIETPAATRIIQDLAPEEGTGPLRLVPFDQLQTGVYEVNVTPTEKLCPAMDFGCPDLEAVFKDYTQRVNEAAAQGKLPDVQAVLVIEDWQKDLKKVTPRIVWTDSGQRKSYERQIFLHRERGSE